MPAGLILWAFIFIVYSSTMALAFRPVREDFTAERDHWAKYTYASVGLLYFSFATSLVWARVAVVPL